MAANFRFKKPKNYKNWFNGFAWNDEMCTAAKELGIVPVEYPTQEQKQRLQRTINDVLSTYIPEAAEDQLCGLFIYDLHEQTADKYKNMWAITLPLPEPSGSALMGFSQQLLEQSRLMRNFVFIHELSHLSHSGHNEDFCTRMTTCFQVYCQNLKNAS